MYSSVIDYSPAPTAHSPLRRHWFHTGLNRCSVFVAATVLAGLCSAKAQINGSDDFNDNSRSTAKWGTADFITGHGTLVEANQRLEYRVASPDPLADNDEADRLWSL